MPRKLPGRISQVVGISLVGASLLMSPFALSEDLQTIQSRGRLVVAVKDNLRPLGFQGADGQLQGLEVEIAQRLARDLLGRADGVILKPVLNQERIAVVLKGEVDIAIARMTNTPSRSRVVAFSVPYYKDGTALITRDSALQRSLDITYQTIAVLDNSTTVEIIRNRFPQAKLVAATSYQSAQTLLDQGKVSAFAADASVLSGWVQENPQYRLLLPTLSVEPLCIVLPKGQKYNELRLRINEILTRWEADGWLRERTAYWGLP